MIEDPPLISIQNRSRRPSESQLALLKGLPTGFIVDAMYGVGALPFDIQALSPGILPQSFCGPALTCNPGPADVLALVVAMSEIQPGDIVVNATGGWTGCAAVGDRVLGMAKNAGASGFVTDGLVRDIDGIEGVGLPVYCAGVSPNSPFNSGPGSIGTPVVLGDRVINDGDVLVADRDGVVHIPLDQLDEVTARARHIATVEAELDAKVAQGLIVTDAVKDLLASDKVKRF